MRPFHPAPIVLLALLLVLGGAHASPPQTAVLDWPLDTLTVETRSGRHRFEVEVAATPAHRERGLMFREDLAADAGMLFLFGAQRVVHMWMKNTYVPLDMLFITADGRIANIVANTEPLSLEIRSSAGPVAAVLELRGGVAAQKGIAPGDRVVHPAFGGTRGIP